MLKLVLLINTFIFIINFLLNQLFELALAVSITSWRAFHYKSFIDLLILPCLNQNSFLA